MTNPGTSPDNPVPRTILAQNPAGGRGMLLHLQRTEAHIPGQVIGLAMNPRDPPRWYSIASAPDCPRYQILYTPLEGGLLTPRLEQAPIGSTLWLHLPRGSFADPALLAKPDTVVWWIANGTGVAPFASFFRHGIRNRRRLVHGCLTHCEAWFSTEFLNPGSTDFTYIPCLSRESSPTLEGAYPGRLTDWLRLNGPGSFGNTDHFMLCGSPGMVVEAREILVSLGIGHERISCETYF